MSELNVAVPLALYEPTWAVSPGHAVSPPAEVGAAHAATMVQVPTMSPPHGSTLPQDAAAPLELELLQPRSVTPMAIQTLKAFIQVLPLRKASPTWRPMARTS